MLDGHPWLRLDELLDEIKSSAVAQDAIPESIALIFHVARLSALLSTPPFVLEDADRVTDELCRFLPTTMADQIAVVWPARYEDDHGEILYAMKVHLWERSRPEVMVTRIVPVPIGGSEDGPSVEIDPPDPWSGRLAAALRSAPPFPVVVDTRFPGGFDLLVAPSGPMAALVPLHLEN